MSLHPPRRTAVRAAAAIGAAVVLAGCSAAQPAARAPSSSTAADSGHDSPATGADLTPVSFTKADATAVLLTAEELGAGYAAIADAQVAAALQQGSIPLAAAVAGMTVEPAECQAVVADALSRAGGLAQQVDQTAIGVYAAGQNVVAELIGPAALLPAGDLGAQAAACSSMTFELSGASGTASVTPVEIDLGDDSSALIVELTMTSGGQQVSHPLAQSVVTDGDAAVSIAVSGAQAEPAALIELTTAAVAKAQPVLG